MAFGWKSLLLLFALTILAKSSHGISSYCDPNLNCLVNACVRATCPSVPGARCISFCNGCIARFFFNGKDVTKNCKIDKRCGSSEESLSRSKRFACGRPCSRYGSCPSGLICCPSGECGLMCRKPPIVTDPKCPARRGKRRRKRSICEVDCYSNKDCQFYEMCCNGPLCGTSCHPRLPYSGYKR
ncbi:uncharacterized protein LOC120335204 [Styela clava]